MVPKRLPAGLVFALPALRTRGVNLAVITLGLGVAYWGYRNWAFMVRHMHLYGEINVTALAQSTTHAPGEAEGFADAFDIGAL